MEQLDKAEPYSIVKLTSVSSEKQMGGGVKCSLTTSDYRPVLQKDAACQVGKYRLTYRKKARGGICWSKETREEEAGFPERTQLH